jgi:hypothetical protein
MRSSDCILCTLPLPILFGIFTLAPIRQAHVRTNALNIPETLFALITSWMEFSCVGSEDDVIVRKRRHEDMVEFCCLARWLAKEQEHVHSDKVRWHMVDVFK